MMRAIPRLTMLFALLLTGLAWTDPVALTQVDESVPSQFQVFTCPPGYAGDDYPDDCAPAGQGEYAITAGDESPTEPTATTETDPEGRVTFATVPGTVSFTLEVPPGTTTYLACFDGDGTFLFDSDVNVVGTPLREGDALSCRWYVTPSAGTGAAVPTATVTQESGSAVTIQVLTCPDYYDGSAFREDCTPGLNDASDGYLIGATNDDVIDGDPDDQGVTELTGIAAGTYSLGVGVFRQYREVYLTCFDVTTGDEVFLFDEIITVASLYATPPNNLITVEAGRDYSCRYYVIPGGTSPDASMAEPSAEPQPSTADDPADATVGVQVFDCPE